MSVENKDLARITIRVDPQVKTNLKVLAARHGMKVNDLLTKASVELLAANDMAVSSRLSSVEQE